MKAIILRNKTRGVNLQIHWYSDSLWSRFVLIDDHWEVCSGECGYVTELSAKCFLQLFEWIPSLGTKSMVDLRCTHWVTTIPDEQVETVKIPNKQVSGVRRWKCMNDAQSCDLCQSYHGLVVSHGKVTVIHDPEGDHKCRCVIVEEKEPVEVKLTENVSFFLLNKNSKEY